MPLLREVQTTFVDAMLGRDSAPAAEYVAAILAEAGLAPALLGPSPSRKSVVARLNGSGAKGPLLLHGHTDVVAGAQ